MITRRTEPGISFYTPTLRLSLWSRWAWRPSNTRKPFSRQCFVKGKLLAELKGHKADVNTAVFSPDGKYIVTASYDGTAIIWPTPETIMEWLKTAPIPKLTAEDKKKLGIEGFNID